MRHLYYLLLILAYPLALLPLRVLYFLSDIIYVLLYYVTGYRKSVVLDNLQQAFPDKQGEELKAIARKFYRNFCDQWLETLKLLTISRSGLNKRMTANWEVFEQLNAAGKDTYALVGHNFNWEWLNVAWQYNVAQQYACFYMPVDNEGFDRIMQRIRTRSGGWLISMKAKKGMQRLQGVRFILGLAADQNPSDIKHAAWLPFMHREAPFFKGPEKLARRAGAAVVFTGTRKIKRGHYQLHFELVTEDASTMPEGEITRRYVQFMEQQLEAQPENWLWSHRRWKYSRTDA
ncbi:MAG: lipid A biosynthesis acyltransferase [Sphingobacteriales bacterium]|nr:MAG: lipid A biosynthesis acyltransferase [Sphingobacteriales bacterium]